MPQAVFSCLKEHYIHTKCTHVELSPSNWEPQIPSSFCSHGELYIHISTCTSSLQAATERARVWLIITLHNPMFIHHSMLSERGLCLKLCPVVLWGGDSQSHRTTSHFSTLQTYRKQVKTFLISQAFISKVLDQNALFLFYSEF